MIRFAKEHKVLSFLFVVSVVLILKNSSIPYLFKMPAFITMIFNEPQNQFWIELAKVIDIFTAAYVTSLLFYLIIEYLPADKKRKQAREIIKPHLENIYLYMSELVAIMEYVITKDFLNNSEDFYNSDKIKIESEEIYCHRICYEEGIEIENCGCTYNVLKDCDKFRRLILDKCQLISSIPVFSYADAEVIQIISEIQLSDLLKLLPRDNPFSYLGENIVYHGIGQAFLNFKNMSNRIKKITGNKCSYKLLEITSEELKTYQRNFVEALEQYLELQKILSGIKDFN